MFQNPDPSQVEAMESYTVQQYNEDFRTDAYGDIDKVNPTWKDIRHLRSMTQEPKALCAILWLHSKYLYGTLISMRGLFESYNDASPYIESVEQTLGRWKSIIVQTKEYFPELKAKNIVNFEVFKQLKDNVPHLFYLMLRKIHYKTIRGFDAHPILLRMEINSETILKDINVHNKSWNLMHRVSYFSNNKPRPYSKMCAFDEQLQNEYDDIVIKYEKYLSLEEKNLTFEPFNWIDTASYVTCVLMISELNGRLGIENIYRGDGTFTDLRSDNIRRFFEIPINQFNDLSLDEVLSLNASGTEHLDDEDLMQI